jgi:hypothetical protein
MGTQQIPDLLISAFFGFFEAMFVLGIAVPALVALLTSIHEFKLLFEREPSYPKSNQG